MESLKRNRLETNFPSPYNQYSFSSNKAGWKLRMKASDNSVLPYENRNISGKKSSVSPVRLKDDLINIETLKMQIKERQQSIKSTGTITIVKGNEVRSERQLSDPKKLLDEFMLPHATIMA